MRTLGQDKTALELAASEWNVVETQFSNCGKTSDGMLTQLNAKWKPWSIRDRRSPRADIAEAPRLGVALDVHKPIKEYIPSVKPLFPAQNGKWLERGAFW
jgi:hypothetical protein